MTNKITDNLNDLEQLMEDLLDIEREANIDRGLPEEENELRIENLSNSNHSIFPKLITCALQASRDGMAIPSIMSDWMLNYIIDHILEKEEPFIIKDIKTGNKADIGVSRHHCYAMLCQISISFKKRRKKKADRMITNIKSNLIDFKSAQIKYRLSPSEYGYLLAKKKEKLTVGDMQEYFEVILNASKSKVKRIFVKYNLNDEIKKLVG